MGGRRRSASTDRVHRPSLRFGSLNIRAGHALICLRLVRLQHCLLLSKRNHAIIPVGNLKVGPSMKEKPDVLQGTLALMVLKTLDVLGPQHGYGIARRIEQISGDLL